MNDAGNLINLRSIEENTNTVQTFTANETVTWSLELDDKDKFTIDDNGSLSFKTPPDFEVPTSANGGNLYQVGIKATDEAGNSSTKPFTVEITDIDEVSPLIIGESGVPGSLTSNSIINENITLVNTFSANEVVSWSLNGGNDEAKFAINTNTGHSVLLMHLILNFLLI